MTEELTPEEVVFKQLIDYYCTPAVEQNLSSTSHLQNDLGLSSLDIVHLGMLVERHYQYDRARLFHIPDEDLMRWETIPDIVKTLEHLLQQS